MAHRHGVTRAHPTPEALALKEIKEGRRPGMRFRVFSRDKFRCVYCGRNPQEDGVKLTIDHVLAISRGGESLFENLVTACQECNLGKGDKSL